jgi:hypothetical protein
MVKRSDLYTSSILPKINKRRVRWDEECGQFCQGIYTAKQGIQTSLTRKAERLNPTPAIVTFFTTETHMDQYYNFNDARE